MSEPARSAKSAGKGNAEALALRHFAHLTPDALEGRFHLLPEPLRAAIDVRSVGISLGAVLYTPATDRLAAHRLLDGHWPGVTAIVLCLEDAIADHQLESGERNVCDLLDDVRARVHAAGSRAAIPFVFVRIRDADHLVRLLEQLDERVAEIDGFVLPKVGVARVREQLDVIASAQRDRDRPLWALPILENRDIAFRELRLESLLELRQIVAAHRTLIPCIRVGATDLCGYWGLRRPLEMTIHDVDVVRDIIADIVNVIGRDVDAPAISGPVWEYVRDPHSAREGLLREALRDRANGLHGKSVIHPAHVDVVDAVHAVSHAEWLSATAVMQSTPLGGGIVRTAGARMDEAKPHARWAELTLARGRAFGVLAPGESFHDLFEHRDLPA